MALIQNHGDERLEIEAFTPIMELTRWPIIKWGLGGRVRRTESGEEEEEEILEEVLSGGKTQDFRLAIRRNLE